MGPPDHASTSAAAGSEALIQHKRRRQTLKSTLTRLMSTCQNQDASVEDKRVRANKAEEIFKEFEKLDPKTSSLWWRERLQDEATTFQQFLKFLDKRVFELESCQKEVTRSIQHGDKQARSQSRTFTTVVQACPECKQQHQIFECEKFKALSFMDKRNAVKVNKLCFNCLQPNHRYTECAASSCRICGERHNTLLHPKKQWVPQLNRDSGASNNRKETQQTNVVSMNVQQQQPAYVLLPTAVIMVSNDNGVARPCRALLDSGSQKTLISEACVQRLNLTRKQDNTTLFGINTNNGAHSRGKIHITITSRTEKHVIATDALCLSSLTQLLPTQRIESEKLKFFDGLVLADEQYRNPAPIDIILGADVFMNCCLPQRITHPSGSPTAMNTIFGWVLLGSIHISEQNQIVSCYVSDGLDQQLQRFWDIEELPAIKHMTQEEEEAEKHFCENTTVDKTGRYVIKLPFKNNEVVVGESKSIALQRLYAMERKFRVQPELQQQYKQFMEQYMKLGHMEVTTGKYTNQMCFLPHHAVFKHTSTTTKLRVVFDASCSTANGKSLNNNLMVGAKQQHDLFDIIIKFRKYKIGFVADIEKMYRQILVHAQDRRYQRILWREDATKDVEEYDLKTVTYGTSAAPFLATRTLQEIAVVNQTTHPSAANAIKNNMYVDDLMCCAANIEDAIQLKNEINTLLSKSCLHLRKWASNSQMFLDTIPEEDRENTAEAHIDDQPLTVNTLGLLWETSTDTFKYSVSIPTITLMVTKRNVLSDIAKVYDPLGWLSPVVIRLKIYMQQLWIKGVGWDESLPEELYDQWVDYRKSIDSIRDLRITRWLQYENSDRVELHGFADASEMAYGAAIYLRVHRSDGRITTNLIAAKTRVAPVKQITLPRLELCGAHLMVKLLRKVQNILEMPNIKIYGWSDSTIVLAWISDHPSKWKSFIANRTTQIINVIPAQNWRHVRSQQNPADLATRGIRPTVLLEQTLWWHGPESLQHGDVVRQPFPNVPKDANMEHKRENVINTAVKIDAHLMHDFSSLSHLIRIVAWLMRFIQNCRNKRDKKSRLAHFLTIFELNQAHQVIIREAQLEMFGNEIKLLLNNKQLASTHELASLSPFVDKNGILRVGGRITNATINYEQKHPAILHRKHYLTTIIVRYYHQKYLHAGNRLLHYMLALKYWIPRAAYAIRQCIYKCPTCMRHRSQPYQQKMGDIPKHRLNAGSVFINVGIDFAGPVQIRSWKGRGAKIYKGWIAIFVCMVTKAVHIELVTELSTAAFIASLRRFVARRGRPNNIFTDNGTNFVGANHHLLGLYKFLNTQSTQEKIIRELDSQMIQWHFSPPAGPHFGGLWEAGVKSMKFHLRRTLGESIVTYEELGTVLCQIEACLNSRPLCLKFEGDVDPLTPAHFLILRPMTAVLDEDYTKSKENRVARWNYVQRLVQQFWQKWSLEYMHQLQQRTKWSKEKTNIKLNDVVLIKEENLAPTQWHLGRVLRVHQGADGLIRVVTLKTAKGEVKRPIVKLCPLTVDVESEAFKVGRDVCELNITPNHSN